MKIGVFDSGIGGLTVLEELRAKLPGADIFYYGDNANVPYGNKSPSEIKDLVKTAAHKIKEQNVDALVMACNTAACIAIEEVQLIMGMIPVFGVVEAGVETVIRQLNNFENSSSFPTLILATRATAQSRVYSSLLKKKLGEAVQVVEQECPLLVSMIEEGWLDNDILKQTLYQYLKPYTHLPPGVCLLGCTHYPWVRSSIEKILPNWTVLDSAQVLAEKLENRMASQDSRKTTSGKIEFVFTDPNAIPKFIRSQFESKNDDRIAV